MIDPVTMQQLRRGLAGAALAASLALLASPASAGQCPADKTKAGVRTSGEMKPKDVTDNVLGMIELGQEKIALADRRLRLRKLVVQPGGIVPWHSHERPAGADLRRLGPDHTNTPATARFRSSTRPARSRSRSSASAHWWKNNGKAPAVLLSADLFHDDKHEDAHDVSGRSAPPSKTPASRGRRSSTTPTGATAMDMSHADDARAEPAHAEAARSRARSSIGLIAFLTVIDLFGTQAILPALAARLRRDAGRDGPCRQRQHLRHGGRRPRGRLFQPPDRPAPRHPGEPRAARGSDRAARRRRRTLPISRCCGSRRALHGLGLHAHARLSRRALQRRRRRRRLCRLHHRQRREQSLRPAVRRGPRRPSRARRRTSMCFAVLNLAGAVLVRSRRSSARRGACRRAGASRLAARDLARAPRATRACGPAFAHRLLHPLRLHRHLHLRQLRPGRARRSALGRWRSASSTSSSCPRSSRRRSPARRGTLRDAADAVGARSASPAAGCRCSSCRACRRCSPASRSSASAPSSPRPTATGFVGRAAAADRGSASGLYLASYFLGGLVGSAVLGQVFDRFGWAACVAGIGAALAPRGALRPAPR